jgi:hypothetical protein
VQWGSPGELPVPRPSGGDPVGDFNGDGTMDVGLPGDYNGDGVKDRAVYRPSTGTWYVQNQFVVQWGSPGDIPASRTYVLPWQ